ncbi:MAG: D-2-hydroxyacid dehydrogenase family protein [Betaproteobacteria bacterium]
MTRIAILDDWQDVARASADWFALERKAEIVSFTRPFGSTDAVAKALAECDIVIAMRERTVFSKALIDQLPKLRMIALTGVRSGTLDFDACTARGIVVCNTGSDHSNATTAEIALALLMAAARHLTTADRGMRVGRFQDEVPLGTMLDGRKLGIAGLGKIGSRMARIGNALGMEVLAWSQNLTAERAQAAGARLVDKTTLFAESDAITLHLVLSDRTRGVVGASELALMKPGAILVNTSRAPLIDEAALLSHLRQNLLVAGLDVFDQEPLPAGHPFRSMPNVVMTPHLGYCSREVYTQFYRESIENVLAFLDGKPIRVVNPTSLEKMQP